MRPIPCSSLLHLLACLILSMYQTCIYRGSLWEQQQARTKLNAQEDGWTDGRIDRDAREGGDMNGCMYVFNCRPTALSARPSPAASSAPRCIYIYLSPVLIHIFIQKVHTTIYVHKQIDVVNLVGHRCPRKWNRLCFPWSSSDASRPVSLLT